VKTPWVASKKPFTDALESDSSSDDDYTIDMKPVKDATCDETIDESDADRDSITNSSNQDQVGKHY